MGDAAGAAAPGARHGASVPRGLQSAAGTAPDRGRFGRMFGFLPSRPLSGDALEALLDLVGTSESGPNTRIPAGYTYLAQFVDHDLTFDPTSQLERVNDPYALVNFRTPRLDLDSLYGAGPDDQPFLYDSGDHDGAGVKLLVGGAQDGVHAAIDLPRNTQGRALAGDPRNDENLITSQLHLVFIRFHNRVVDHVREHRGLAGAELLEEAQRVVRWHYQWVVAHDLLPRIAGDEMVASVLDPDPRASPRVRRRFYRWRDRPYIPVEFSGAAYRFGHSMVRTMYDLNADRTKLPVFSTSPSPGELDHLGGFRRLPAELEIEWGLFFELSAERRPQPSFAIDTGIAPALLHLPAAVSSEPQLPRRNILRAQALELPCGRDVALAMGETPLTERQLRFDRAPAELRDELMRRVPLWYYVLREAKALHGGEQLGPVGGRIVAEVLVGVIEADPSSYLRRWPAWQPEFANDAGVFDMAELVKIATGERTSPPPAPLP